MSRFIHQYLRPVSAALTLGSVAFGGLLGEANAAAPARQGEGTPSIGQDDTPRTSMAEGASSAGKVSQGEGARAVPAGDGVQAHGVEHIHVIGHPFNTIHASNDMGRMPQDVMHTPQVIDVVPRELIKQQNAKSLDEALKNVPGITASVGEGAGGLNGDQFLIRGFPAQNDIYEDGLRDFGVYARDSFDYDSINVIKGPSSEVFGNGTTGGAINAVTKTPTTSNHYNADFSGGSGDRGIITVGRWISISVSTIQPPSA